MKAPVGLKFQLGALNPCVLEIECRRDSPEASPGLNDEKSEIGHNSSLAVHNSISVQGS
jgi:hypothetical protein